MQWVGAGAASGCPRAFQGTAHQLAVAAEDFGSRPSAAAVRWSYSLGACPQGGGCSAAGH